MAVVQRRASVAIRANDMNVPPQEASIANGSTPARPTSLATHYLRYSTTNVLVLIAGFVSFPVLTRLLDNHQYGILGYYDTWGMIAIAVAKLGSQHAIIRFYPYHGDPRGMVRFGTNLVYLPMVLSVLLWGIFSIGMLGYSWWSNSHFPLVLWFVVMLTPVQVIINMLQMVVRASERSDILMATRVIGRWAELALVLGAVILLQHSALAVFGGKIAAALLLLFYFARWARRNIRFSRDAVDLGYAREGMSYGVPLMANEMVALVLVAIDRIMLKQMTGDFAAVGIYTIGYSLATQINVFVNASLSEAFGPVVNRVYDTGGESAVQALKERMLLPMTYASVAIATMLIAVGEDALVALTGPSKAASGAVFVVVGTTLALFPLFDISSYGLLLRKRSSVVFVITGFAAALNVALNFVLIPRYGYMGSAWATAASYVVLAIARYMWCPRGLMRFPDLRTVGLAVGSALLLLAVVEGTDMFGVHAPWPRLFVGGGLFVALYALPIWLLDPRLRKMARQWRSGQA